MTLRTHPKMTWEGKSVWDDPSSWGWITTIYGSATSVQGIEKSGRLISVRPFSDKHRGAAIELLVGFEKAVFSTVIRLDDLDKAWLGCTKPVIDAVMRESTHVLFRL